MNGTVLARLAVALLLPGSRRRNIATVESRP
jgi:hypothetical protein